LLPFNLPENYATIQVINNGVASNRVTVYANNTAPAVFTTPIPNGVGMASALHANLTQINTASPARPGESILLFLTGLGAVNPPVADGVPAPSNPLSATVVPISVLFGIQEGLVTFSGLAPGFVGLYQINVTVPANSGSVNPFLGIVTPDAINQEATLPVAATATGTGERGEISDASDSDYRPARAKRLSNKSMHEGGARRVQNQQ
jgi:uncharacterized protein (TIGR03437 family)